MLITTNALEIAARMGHGAEAIEDAADQAVNRCGTVVEQSAGRFIGRIYARPTNGWERTGDLQDGLHLDRPTKTSAVLEIIGRAATYARFRHDLDRPGRDGITRFNPFFDQAEEATEPQIQLVFENEFTNRLEDAMQR